MGLVSDFILPGFILGDGPGLCWMQWFLQCIRYQITDYSTPKIDAKQWETVWNLEEYEVHLINLII
jgi:hypothetical protein